MKYAIELSRKQAARILQCASRAHQQVRFQSKSWADGKGLAMHLANCEEGCLHLEAEWDDQVENILLPNTYCQIEMEIEDNDYFFDSHILSVRRHQEVLNIEVVCPETILVQQRRRSKRKTIASSSDVQISREENDELHIYEGKLYNLSEDGLAFKISKTQSSGVDIGQIWCVCFEVPEQSYCYKLEAVVRRKVPSSSEGDIILGMEFELGDVDQLKQLHDFLSDRQKVKIRD